MADEYVAFVVRAAAEARSLARKKPGRSAAHVLLLHLNLRNAHHLDGVMSALESAG